ncbi:MAG: serine/threonine-protein kinase [Akkermansiaceae bacterium]
MSVEEIAPHFPELEIIELLGSGGMGAVYKARQPQLDRVVALKILSNDLASDPAFSERFNREARVLARLNHPNIVGIFEYGSADTLCYLLMEYVDGVNLRQAMQAGRFSPTESLVMVEDICSALKFAHEEGILHRDIKPENVLIDSKGRIKIADFGIAKLIGESEQADVTLTMQGSVLGSPHYMAPEQIETPNDVDQRADIYSLGVVFYELLTGELPLGRFALPSEKVTMDSRIDEIVIRTLEKERQARFQSAEEVMTQVSAVAMSPGVVTAAPAKHSSGESGSVRFSLVGAILTGLSLVGILAGVTIAGEYRDLGLTKQTANVLSILMFVMSSMMAITGFIFGSVALGSIRNSGGEKGGLGSSVFAVVVWPILLLGVLSTVLLKMPIPNSSGGRSVGPLVLLLFIGVPQIIAAFILVRGLRRWARGVVSKNGKKCFPRLGLTIFASVGVVILGVVLLEVSSRFFPRSEQRDHFSEIQEEMAREESRYMSMTLTGSPSTNDVSWYRGAPEAIFPVEIYPRVRADFRLARFDANGNPEYVEIGSLLGVNEGGQPIQSFVRIGTSGPKQDGREAERGFSAVVDFTGQNGGLYGESDFSGWEFDFEPNQKLNLLVPGQYSVQVATRSVQVEGGKGRAAYLKLEINVSRQ